METLRLAILSVLLATGCGSTKVVAVPAIALEDADPRPLPWNPHVHAGEYALYDLKVRGLVIGEIEVATGEPGLIDGAVAHYVVMRGTTAGIAEVFADAEIEITAEISADPDRPRTTRGRWKSIFRGRERQGSPITRYPPGRFGPVSAMVALRGWRAEPGDAVSFAVGRGRATELVLVARGRVSGPFRRPARRLVGVARTGRKAAPFEVWISDDRDRVPLLVRFGTQYGDVTLELVGYRRDSQRSR